MYRHLDSHIAPRPTSQEFPQLKVIPVNQAKAPANPLNSATEVKSPVRTTEDGTELSLSPYAVLKNRLMLSSTQSKNQQATQVDFSNRVSERMLFQSESAKSKTNSTAQIMPNQDLAELAGVAQGVPGPDELLLGGQQLVPTPFGAQGQPDQMKASSIAEPGVPDGPLALQTDEPKIRTIGIQHEASREETNQTVLLGLQARDQS